MRTKNNPDIGIIKNLKVANITMLHEVKVNTQTNGKINLI